MEQITGSVTGVNGNLVSVRIDGSIRKNEVGYVLVDGKRLKGEIIRVGGGIADMQIYEMTNGIKVGDKAEFTGELMSVSLGPGLLTQIYDGLQNPLPELAEKCGFYACSVPVLDQYILARLLDDGSFERHINRVRRARRKALSK